MIQPTNHWPSAALLRASGTAEDDLLVKFTTMPSNRAHTVVSDHNCMDPNQSVPCPRHLLFPSSFPCDRVTICAARGYSFGAWPTNTETTGPVHVRRLVLTGPVACRLSHLFAALALAKLTGHIRFQRLSPRDGSPIVASCGCRLSQLTSSLFLVHGATSSSLVHLL